MSTIKQEGDISSLREEQRGKKGERKTEGKFHSRHKGKKRPRGNRPCRNQNEGWGGPVFPKRRGKIGQQKRPTIFPTQKPLCCPARKKKSVVFRGREKPAARSEKVKRAKKDAFPGWKEEGSKPIP